MQAVRDVDISEVLVVSGGASFLAPASAPRTLANAPYRETGSRDRPLRGAPPSSLPGLTSVASLLASWKQSTSGCSTVAVNRLYLRSRGFLFIHILPANHDKNKEPTSGLEPLTCSSYECAVRRCRDLQGFANPLYLSRILFSAFPHVAGYCAPGGIRVVSGVRGLSVAGSCSSLGHAHQYAAPSDVGLSSIP